MPYIPVIVGPTAGGKSAVGVAIAGKISNFQIFKWSNEEGSGGGVSGGRGVGAEIVTADAFQIYRGMDIGTAKPTAAERGGVVHHLIDVVEPANGQIFKFSNGQIGSQALEIGGGAHAGGGDGVGHGEFRGGRFTAAQWVEMAEDVISEIRGRGNVPIVVGGTNLYVKCLIEGMFEGPGADEGVRAELRAMEPGALWAELERVDAATAARLHPNDMRRTVRAIEVFRLTGRRMSELRGQWGEERAKLPNGQMAKWPNSEEAGAGNLYKIIGLEWGVEAINKRINARVRGMVEAGLVEEARELWRAGRLGEQAREALGYKQLIAHFEKKCSLDEAIEKIKIETRRFAKNQRTWLKRMRVMPGAVWLEAEGKTAEELAAEAVGRLVSGE
jgi:tRNA dimethylallyltransferase